MTYIIEFKGKYKGAIYRRSLNKGTTGTFKSKAAAKIALAANFRRYPTEDEMLTYRIREVKVKK